MFVEPTSKLYFLVGWLCVPSVIFFHHLLVYLDSLLGFLHRGSGGLKRLLYFGLRQIVFIALPALFSFVSKTPSGKTNAWLAVPRPLKELPSCCSRFSEKSSLIRSLLAAFRSAAFCLVLIVLVRQVVHQYSGRRWPPPLPVRTSVHVFAVADSGYSLLMAFVLGVAVTPFLSFLPTGSEPRAFHAVIRPVKSQAIAIQWSRFILLLLHRSVIWCEEEPYFH